MRRSWIGRIRDKITLRKYDMTTHATEEMAEGDLNIVDIEHAVLTGRVKQIQRDDPRGNKYLLEGRLRTVRPWSGWWDALPAATGI